MTDTHRAHLRALLDAERQRFTEARRVLSYDEYLDLVSSDPRRHTRDAGRYLRDVFDHYGTRPIERPHGLDTRWNLFDLPWEDEEGKRDALAGHERLQAEVYRALSNFARQGRVDRLVLLHGPNGSAKSTFVACLMRALEHYSTLDEGAIYRFHWVFPRGRGGESRIGFGSYREGEEGPRAGESFAHLDETQIDAKIPCELRDHPLLLLPTAIRHDVLERGLGADETPPAHLWRGGMSQKSRQIYDALVTAYRGDLGKVFAHVQVERWYFSRRYREGLATIGPQMAVDAKERQITASRSIAALPASLQNVTLFEPFGELVDAAGGLLEYSDLLKRPLEAWKYLLLMIETGEVALNASIVAPNLVLVGSSNEVHVDAFREHPEYPSFRGRLELVRAPYLLDWREEQRIYDRQVAPGVRKHVAPHATEVAALFAVLTRMKKPAAERYGRTLGAIAADLTPLEKAELYADGAIPPRLSAEQAKELRVGIAQIFTESDVYPNYEGRVGASPREMRTLILDAAQHPGYECLSPFAVLEEIAKLVTRRGEFEWLRQDPLAGGYHDTKHIQRVLRERLLEQLETELRDATGLVDEARYHERFDRYVQHVNTWVKGEKLRDRHTGRDVDPDESLMREIESVLGATGPAADFRRNLISTIAAWAIDHPGAKIENVTLFPRYLQKLKESFFAERRKQVVTIAQDLLRLLTEGTSLDADARARAERTLEGLEKRHGYNRASAKDLAAVLLRERFTEPRP